MIEKEYADYAWEQAEALLGVDSPSGFTHNAAQWVLEAFRNLGYEAHLTGKGAFWLTWAAKTARMGCCWLLTPIPWGAWCPRSKAPDG